MQQYLSDIQQSWRVFRQSFGVCDWLLYIILVLIDVTYPIMGFPKFYQYVCNNYVMYKTKFGSYFPFWLLVVGWIFGNAIIPSGHGIAKHI